MAAGLLDGPLAGGGRWNTAVAIGVTAAAGLALIAIVVSSYRLVGPHIPHTFPIPAEAPNQRPSPDAGTTSAIDATFIFLEPPHGYINVSLLDAHGLRSRASHHRVAAGEAGVPEGT